MNIHLLLRVLALPSLAAFLLSLSACVLAPGSPPAPATLPVTPTTALAPTNPLVPQASSSPTGSFTPRTSPNSTLPPSPYPSATLTPVPFPALTLKPGDFYFRLDGKPTFILSRNPTGKNQADFYTLLDWMRQGGSRLVRVHLTFGWWGDPWINPDWSVNPKWARDWDWFFNQAQANGISVIPVFGVWADWNGGKPDFTGSTWKWNPLNSANSGPLAAPDELFKPDSDAQKRWLAWVKTLVQRWQGRPNITAWEIFSEINLASGPAGHRDARGGPDEATGVDFTRRAMEVIHAADPQHRPVTISLAGVYPPTDPWAEYYRLSSLDFIEIHPYHDQLDRQLVKEVRQALDKYQKPVMIGETGLWSTAIQPNAHLGIEHAMWAGLVSGAMNGRSLWSNDGYAIYDTEDRDLAMQYLQAYATTELPVANFVDGVDFSGFHPLNTASSSGVWGAAVGSVGMALGWFRDAACEPPVWNLKPLISKQTVTLTLPEGAASRWKIDFYNPKSGTDLTGSVALTSQDGRLVIPLPDFSDDIAFKAYPEVR